jgi:hypothetical protein
MEKLSCAQAKQIDLVNYLASLGHNPHKVSRDDYWYSSPFRDEKTPSFKVNRKLNVWFDFGEGKGGNLIDFGTRYFHCTVVELLEKLRDVQPPKAFAFPSPNNAGEKKNSSGKILILEDRRISAKPLLEYIEKRCIPLDVAQRYCREVDFLLYDKKYTTIGFKNNAGGYELRTEHFKGSSSPKDVSFVDNNSEKIAVFEGFIDYLSYHSIRANQLQPLPNFLVLNSLSFFEKCREKMESHQQINLMLDRDSAGQNLTEKALQWDRLKYFDRSNFYDKCKDLNEWLIKRKQDLKQSRGMRRGF